MTHIFGKLFVLLQLFQEDTVEERKRGANIRSMQNHKTFNCFSANKNSLVMEFIQVLHIAEDDVLFVDDPWRDFLNTTGHFPEIRLRKNKNIFKSQK